MEVGVGCDFVFCDVGFSLLSGGQSRVLFRLLLFQVPCCLLQRQYLLAKSVVVLLTATQGSLPSLLELGACMTRSISITFKLLLVVDRRKKLLRYVVLPVAKHAVSFLLLVL